MPGSRKRQASIEAHGFDTKFAYHIVRLALECEPLLESGQVVLNRDGALYRSIRTGEWNEACIVGWSEDKERSLERLYGESALPHEAGEEALRRLLLECLEMHYGSLAATVADGTRHPRGTAARSPGRRPPPGAEEARRIESPSGPVAFRARRGESAGHPRKRPSSAREGGGMSIAPPRAERVAARRAEVCTLGTVAESFEADLQ